MQHARIFFTRTIEQYDFSIRACISYPAYNVRLLVKWYYDKRKKQFLFYFENVFALTPDWQNFERCFLSKGCLL